MRRFLMTRPSANTDTGKLSLKALRLIKRNRQLQSSFLLQPLLALTVLSSTQEKFPSTHSCQWRSRGAGGGGFLGA